METRGFILGSPIAFAIEAKFVPFRKPKKLIVDFLCPLPLHFVT